ncbi:hypothetical protein JCM13304A_22120 [Desulfothermus okinawensis JCM 13304]
MQYVTALDISLKENEVHRCLGYKKQMKPSREISRMLREIFRGVLNRFQALATYKMIQEFHATDGKVLTPFGEIQSRKISSLARKAKNLLVGLVTVPEIVANITGDDLTRDYLVYGVGTAVVEKGVDSLLLILEKETGLYASLPFSPGYCDWDIRGQGFIFKAIDPSPVNVKLISKSFRMVPIHTISFVSLLGIQNSDRNPCRYCTAKRCSFRRP